MKKIAALAAIIIVLGAIGWAATRGTSTRDDSRLSVVTSFYPLYFFASEIGGDHASITNIVPAGSEPHDYEPTPRDIAAIESADIVLLNGEGFEAWGERIASNVSGSVIEVADGLATLEGTAHESDEGAGEQHDEAGYDPHVWLSPPLARQMVARITEAYTAADPQNAAFYRANAAALDAKLAALDEQYRTGLASCVRREIITSHAAFGYVAKQYGLTQVALAGLSPEEEPTTQTIAQIASFAKEHGVTHIFFETLVPADFSKTVATEIGAQTLVLNPLEGLAGEELSSGKTYLTEMQQNLANLRAALQCTE